MTLDDPLSQQSDQQQGVPGGRDTAAAVAVQDTVEARYCEVGASAASEGQGLSLMEEVMGHLNNMSSSRPAKFTLPPPPPPPPPRPENNGGEEEDVEDLSNYDLQTVIHPPVTTNAQGYSYCDVGFCDGSPAVAWSGNGGSATSAPADRAIGYSEIDVMSPTTGAPPPPPPPHPPSQRPLLKPPAPETAPKPRKKKSENDEVLVDEGLPRLPPTADRPELPWPPVAGEEIDDNLSDDDSLYARVSDVKTQNSATSSGGCKIDSPPSQPSPKPKRKKKLGSSDVGRTQSPKMKRKAPPRRRPPPPPRPPGAKIPGSVPLPPSNSSPNRSPTTPPSAPPCSKITSSPSHKERRFEQSLPPIPSSQPLSRSSPSHRPALDDLATTLATTLQQHRQQQQQHQQACSPKLPQRKGPLPPSPVTKGGGSDPPSPLQKRGIFNRVKSSSLKTRKSDNHHSTTTHSPLATDEYSPKSGWKNVFRFRRGSGTNAAANNAESSNEGGMSPDEPGSSLTPLGASSGGGRESRRRRNQEDKLPEVPKASKSLSLPSPSQQVGGASVAATTRGGGGGGGGRGGFHLHPYDGEEEEEEEEVDDDLYSVVDKPNKTQLVVSIALSLFFPFCVTYSTTACVLYLSTLQCTTMTIYDAVKSSSGTC